MLASEFSTSSSSSQLNPLAVAVSMLGIEDIVSVVDDDLVHVDVESSELKTHPEGAPFASLPLVESATHGTNIATLLHLDRAQHPTLSDPDVRRWPQTPNPEVPLKF